MNVLIVDDDFVDREHVSRALNDSREVHHITTSESVDDASQKCISNTYDVILLDYSLPGRDGIELLHELKNGSESNQSAIIMMSNSEDEDLIRSCIQAGAHDFVAKTDLKASRLKNSIINAQTRFELEYELKISYEKIKRLAQRDNLTGIFNRAFFEEQLKNSIAYATRNNKSLGLIILDLDNFKDVNDSFGHDSGDTLLQGVTKNIQSILRSTEIFARLGGDEFAILCQNLNCTTDLSYIGHRILKILSNPMHIGDSSITTSSSIGISCFPRDGETGKKLLKNADIAMYRAKKSGKNNFAFFEEEMQLQVIERVNIEKGLKRALTDKHFVVHYQPIYSSKENSFIKIEALVRWRDKGKLIAPDKFIGIAETTGMIIEIGHWVILKSCEDLAKIRDQYKTDIKMSINLSSRQLSDRKLISHITYCLQHHNIPASSLEFELTETSLINHTAQNLSTISALNKLGCSLSLDDFGTGYSSISHLQDFPISTVKLDKSILPTDKDLHSKKKELLLEGVVRMIKTLQLDIISEGVETARHVELCKSMNIDNLQGYYFSKPVELLEVLHVINNFNYSKQA